MSRGDHREPIFLEAADRAMFLSPPWLRFAPRPIGRFNPLTADEQRLSFGAWRARPNLAEGMKWLLGTYTARFNRKHRLFGHLFSGRYKSLLVDNSGNGYFKTVCDPRAFEPGARPSSPTR